MPAIYQITFLPSGQTREFCGSRGDYYELGDGSHIDVNSRPDWCDRCQDFTDGESIEGLEKIAQELADLRDPTSELYRFYHDSGTGSIGVAGIPTHHRSGEETAARRRG